MTADTQPGLNRNRAAPKPVNGQTKVLYIAGAGRSGSTLLALMLGRLPGWFAAGELRYLWERGLIEHRLCGCGRPVQDCPVWSVVVARVGGIDMATTHRMIAAIELTATPSFIVSMLRDPAHAERNRQLEDLPARLGSLYAGLRDVTGCDTIVDSSKPPTYGGLVGALPGIDLYVVHLVRDPRAAAFSWLRHKPAPDRPSGGEMARKTVPKSALHWNAWNAVAECLWRTESDRYLRLRYEDLVADPEDALDRVRTLIGDVHVVTPRFREHWLEPGVAHTVAGNPSRLEHEAVEIQLDMEWQLHLAARHRRLTTALCAPLMVRYGYDLRKPPHPRSSHES